jgi:hypothetical protein
MNTVLNFIMSTVNCSTKTLNRAVGYKINQVYNLAIILPMLYVSSVPAVNKIIDLAEFLVLIHRYLYRPITLLHAVLISKYNYGFSFSLPVSDLVV